MTINNFLYVLGSKRLGSDEYKACYRFSPRTLEWQPIAPFLRDRSRFGVANIGNYIYIFGGFEGFKKLVEKRILFLTIIFFFKNMILSCILYKTSMTFQFKIFFSCLSPKTTVWFKKIRKLYSDF